jgi:nickel/cobalt exporter
MKREPAMTSFAELLQQGASNAWFFIPTAIFLGVLHGLEPGHSKTMMAAFIVAIRGTVFQAVLLGLAATLSHTLIVWGIALGGMYLWQGLDAEKSEPYFQLASAAIIIAIAVWMFQRTWRDRRLAREAEARAKAYDEDRSRRGEAQRVDTGHGILALEIPEGPKPAHWRIRSISGDPWAAEYVTLATERPDGRRQAFTFVDCDGFIESVEPVEEPYDFMARLSLDHGDHEHAYDVSFVKGTGSDPLHAQQQGLALATGPYQDAHELAHANDIRKRFTNRNVTTWQIVLFGLTGGLIPCPAAVTVLLLCLQLKEFTLGAALVLCFSIGLAITLVAVGAVAAIGVRHATQRVGWFSTVAGRAPYFSSALIILVGLYVGWHGWTGIRALQTAAL